MAGLKDIRDRIASVKSTKQITAAMKTVAAAKLKKAQDRVTQIKPYADKLQEVIAEVSSGLNKEHGGVYNSTREIEKVLIVLISSNRGLCGGFNANVGKKAMSYVGEYYSIQKTKNNVKFFCIGKKAYDFVVKNGYEVIDANNNIFDNLDYSNVVEIAEFLMKSYEMSKFDKIEIIYNSFKNAAVQEQKVEQFLPVTLEVEERQNPSEYIFEPNLNQIIDEMIPKSLKIQLFKSILDSNAAEQGARMTAMHQATDNATELINDLTLVYNKARQAAITNEILEITSGAEALK